MRRSQICIATLVLGIATAAATCQAQLTEVIWGGSTGASLWRDGANWVGGNFPDGALQVADLSVDLGAGLTVDIGSDSDTTIAGLSLGSQSGNVLTDITGSGTARLVFDNADEEVVTPGNDADFDNNTVVDGADFLIWQRGFGLIDVDDANEFGDANDDGDVNGIDLEIWETQFGLGSGFQNPGNPFIETIGVAGATNTITASVHALNGEIEIGGTKDLTIAGNITYEGDGTSLLSNSGIRAMTPGLTVTVTGGLTMIDTDSDEAEDFTINEDKEAQGTMIFDGVISGAGTLVAGTRASGARLPLGTIQLNSANTFTGSFRAARGNLVLGDDAALGTGSYTQRGNNDAIGINMISTADTRNIANEFNLAHWQTVKGANSLELSGEVSQTNDRGFLNLLPAGKDLTLSGRLNIFDVDEFTESPKRKLTFDGTGKTIIQGVDASIRDIPSEAGDDGIFGIYGVRKTGTGSLVIDVPAGANDHYGSTTVLMGNLHYANNDSLNSDPNPESKIFAFGGAVGVDSGVATNTTFAGKIDPTSTGGLMLAASDANQSLNFTTTLANAANMTVAAPDGTTPAAPYEYTGTITPANSTYGLGGGTGTIRLPDAQLSGANDLQVRNGGTVQLFGDNTYMGATRIQAKYGTSLQNQAIADTVTDIGTLFYDETAPVLEVDVLANGGFTSSIGSAGTAAENLVIQGSTLRYVGTGDTTNRLFSIGTAGATLDSSGTSGAVVFSNPGALGVPDAADQIGSLRSVAGGSGAIVYDVADTSDIVVGMPISDPDPGGPQFICGNLDGRNCIPDDATVTSISDDGTQIGLSDGYPDNIQKLNTKLVFGTVERTLNLTGSNAGNNEIASSISDSANGGAVAINKSGSGKWILSGSNTYTGDTTVEEGILSITSDFLDDASTVNLLTGGFLELGFTGNDIVDALFIDGAQQADGLWGEVGNGAATFTSSLLNGSGLLDVGGVPLGALANVPEPGSLLLTAMAYLGLAGTRRRFKRK